MSIKLTRRIAAELLKRGESKVRIKPDAIEDAKKAITREDVRALIKSGSVYALKEKHNMSLYSKDAQGEEEQGQEEGSGKEEGNRKAQAGLDYKKKIRGQRRVLEALKTEKHIDNVAFKKYYALVKGGNFAARHRC